MTTGEPTNFEVKGKEKNYIVEKSRNGFAVFVKGRDGDWGQTLGTITLTNGEVSTNPDTLKELSDWDLIIRAITLHEK